jgi:hypothetical protein
MRRYNGNRNPLLTDLRVVRGDLEEFGTHLEEWLAEKTEDGRLALEEMARLVGPVDELHDAIAASQRLLNTSGMDGQPGVVHRW